MEKINAKLRKIIGHRVNHGGLGIPDPQMSEKSAYNTSKAARGELVDSLLGGTALNYVGHRVRVCGASAGRRKEQKHVEMAELARQKELAGDQDRNRLHKAISNWVWLSAVPHRLNVTELSWEELRDDICLRYGLMPLDIPATCDGCDKRFLTKNALACPKGGLVLVRNYEYPK